jgi:hypothetical protein
MKIAYAHCAGESYGIPAATDLLPSFLPIAQQSVMSSIEGLP